MQDKKKVSILSLVIIPMKHWKGKEREKEGQAPMISLALGIPSIKEELLFESKSQRQYKINHTCGHQFIKSTCFISIINK